METFKREIFEQLGNLFYAVAAEQNISLLASGELKMLFRKDWLAEPVQRTDDKVSEPAHLIGLTVDSLQSENALAADTFAAFERFYRKHAEQFSFSLKESVLDTTTRIMSLFPVTGKRNLYAAKVIELFQESMQGTSIR